MQGFSLIHKPTYQPRYHHWLALIASFRIFRLFEICCTWWILPSINKKNLAHRAATKLFETCRRIGWENDIQTMVKMDPSPKTIDLCAKRSNEIRGSRELRDNRTHNQTVNKLHITQTGGPYCDNSCLKSMTAPNEDIAVWTKKTDSVAPTATNSKYGPDQAWLMLRDYLITRLKNIP